MDYIILDNLVISLPCTFLSVDAEKETIGDLGFDPGNAGKNHRFLYLLPFRNTFFLFRLIYVALTFKFSLFQGLVLEPPDIKAQ